MIRCHALGAFAKCCKLLTNNETRRELRPRCCKLTLKRFKITQPENCYTEEGLKACYSHEQQLMILRVMNSASVEELRRHAVTKQRATSLVRQRDIMGDFTKLDDIFEVEYFGIKHIQNLCDSIIYGPSEEDKKSLTSSWQQICQPSVSDELKKTLKSVVALNINPKGIVWMHLGRDMDLFRWDHMELTAAARNYNLKYSLELAHKVLETLPEADAYIMERRQQKSKHAGIIPSILGIFQLESTLTALLNKDFASNSQHRVFTIKDSLVARFFDLKIGNEAVSSQDMAKRMLSGMHSGDFRRVNCDSELRQWYNEQTSSNKELLANCLLQSIAFYELEVFRKKIV